MKQFFIADRHKGYERALKDHELAYDPKRIYNDFAFLPSDGYNLAKDTLDLENIDGMVIST